MQEEEGVAFASSVSQTESVRAPLPFFPPTHKNRDHHPRLPFPSSLPSFHANFFFSYDSLSAWSFLNNPSNLIILSLIQSPHSDYMDVLSQQHQRYLEAQGPSDTRPSLMACPFPGHLYTTTHHHIIDMTPRPSYDEASTATTTQDIPNTARLPVSQISNGSNSRNSSFMRQERSPLNSGFWISIELVLTICQIVASVVVLSLSRHEHPHTPLFEWIVGYASGCVATLPLLYWRYYHGNHVQDRISGPSSTLPSTSRTNGGEGVQVAALSPRNNQASWLMNTRLKVLMEHFKMALDCFFAVWFIAGNVWIFGGHSSANEAPNLYRLCIVFLTFSCIGYAMPFIICATICCCLPCVISILGAREDLMQTKGATSESINALPTYKFKMKENKSRDESNSVCGEGGIVAAGTEKERLISGEDAVCCICLAKYENNDELRELPCSHLFHKNCIDKWLKINALCPLCKGEVGENVAGSVSGEDASQQQGESRVDNGLANASS